MPSATAAVASPVTNVPLGQRESSSTSGSPAIETMPMKATGP